VNDHPDPTASFDRPVRVQYPRWLWGVGALVAAVVAGAVAVLVVVGEGGSPSQAGGGVEALIPSDDSQILQQATVGIDLAPGYQAELSVNGVPLPLDQVVVERGLNTVTFTPGPGRAYERWPAGETCLTAHLWPVENPTAVDVRTWCFTVV
jgi:hypothetical protein